MSGERVRAAARTRGADVVDIRPCSYRPHPKEVRHIPLARMGDDAKHIHQFQPRQNGDLPAERLVRQPPKNGGKLCTQQVWGCGLGLRFRVAV